MYALVFIFRTLDGRRWYFARLPSACEFNNGQFLLVRFSPVFTFALKKDQLVRSSEVVISTPILSDTHLLVLNTQPTPPGLDERIVGQVQLLEVLQPGAEVPADDGQLVGGEVELLQPVRDPLAVWERLDVNLGDVIMRQVHLKQRHTGGVIV